jgi:hypothetical protein
VPSLHPDPEIELGVDAALARPVLMARACFVKQGSGNKIGEKIVHSRVPSCRDAADSPMLAHPCDRRSFPLGRPMRIDNGVLKQVYYSRLWAKKQGRVATRRAIVDHGG